MQNLLVNIKSGIAACKKDGFPSLSPSSIPKIKTQATPSPLDPNNTRNVKILYAGKRKTCLLQRKNHKPQVLSSPANGRRQPGHELLFKPSGILSPRLSCTLFLPQLTQMVRTGQKGGEVNYKPLNQFKEDLLIYTP